MIYYEENANQYFYISINYLFYKYCCLTNRKYPINIRNTSQATTSHTVEVIFQKVK